MSHALCAHCAAIRAFLYCTMVQPLMHATAPPLKPVALLSFRKRQEGRQKEEGKLQSVAQSNKCLLSVYYRYFVMYLHALLSFQLNVRVISTVLLLCLLSLGLYGAL